MTEDEAKSKTCPFMSEGWFNRDGKRCYSHAETSCIASKCMMWQWDITEINPMDAPYSDKITKRLEVKSTEYGRCGLTGINK